jgi:hypothetical protein
MSNPLAAAAQVASQGQTGGKAVAVGLNVPHEIVGIVVFEETEKFRRRIRNGNGVGSAFVGRELL